MNHLKQVFILLSLSFLCTPASAQEIIQDIDGNEYITQRIYNQTWMTKNVNVAHYRNGDPIPEAKSINQWYECWKKRIGCWCYYRNSKAKGLDNGELYNWFAVTDSRGISPNGWHVSTDSDWVRLTNYLKEEIAAKKIKSLFGWYENGNGTNESGLMMFPGGYRADEYGTFLEFGKSCRFWAPSSTEIIGRALNYGLDYINSIAVGMTGAGYYIRLIKD